MTTTVYVGCPGCDEAEHTVVVTLGEEEVTYLRDGSGCPATADEAEIIASGCDCLDLEPGFGVRIQDLAIEQVNRHAWED